MPRTTLLRQLLQQRHLTTHEAFAMQYERAAVRLAELDRDPRLASLQVSSRQFDRWYGGELLTLPRPDACRVLEHMLGRPVSELFSPVHDGCSESGRSEEPRTREQGPSPLLPREDDENPLLIIARARQLTASNTDGATLAFLVSSLEGIAGRYEQDGPYTLRPQARQVRQLAHTLLDGRQPPNTRRELFRLAARASGLLGYMAVNTGDFVLSEAYCTEARDLSREIGDLDTELWAHGTLSFGLYYAGRYDEADACAVAAVERAPRHAQTIRLLANGRARALSKTGDRRAAEQAIGQALRLSDLHEVPVGLTSCISFEPYGRARTLANAVTSHVALRNTTQVLRDAEHIDDLVEHSASCWSRSLVRLDVATALLQQRAPDIDQAMVLGSEALRLCGDTPISSVYQRSRDLREQAGPWRDHPAVRDYGEEFQAWSSQPAVMAMASSAS
ncbi:tetratricopeptide repeat protein [Streptomyces sp. NPDC090106]|uniref:tetratricopeptide repeat protein n=1 Tax=Streptomyces sp. NPDC090106 TaxID=3365946 RepID=UPI0037FF5711